MDTMVGRAGDKDPKGKDQLWIEAQWQFSSSTCCATWTPILRPVDNLLINGTATRG